MSPVGVARLAGRAGLRVERWWAEGLGGSVAGWDSPVLAPPLRLAPRGKELVARHWLEGRTLRRGDKVAWVTSGAPVELLRAVGFHIVYPENHGAMCGAARMAVELCEGAEDAGYSRDLCSYARTDCGALLSGRTPVGRVPLPDLLLTASR